MNPGAVTKNLQKLGHYRLIELLGFNGVFASYKGQESGGNPVAVVAVQQERMKDENPWKFFCKEIDPFIKGGARRVCKPLAFGHDLGHYWASYEWLPGCHLGENVRNNGLPPVAESFEIVADLVDALADLHKNGALHRIVNPASIFLTESGDLMLLHAAWGRLILGTKGGLLNDAFSSILPFVAPEILGRMEGDESSDVYSVGANLYFLLTGQPTFWNDNSEELARQIRQDPVDLRDLKTDLDGDAVEVLEEMLAKDPEDRPVNLPALSTRLRRISRELMEEEERSAESALAASMAPDPGQPSQDPYAQDPYAQEYQAPESPEPPQAPQPPSGVQPAGGFQAPPAPQAYQDFQQAPQQGYGQPPHMAGAPDATPSPQNRLSGVNYTPEQGAYSALNAMPAQHEHQHQQQPPPQQVTVFEEEVETATQRRQRLIIMGVSGGVLVLALMLWGMISIYSFVTREPEPKRDVMNMTDLTKNIQEQQMTAVRYAQVREMLILLGQLTQAYNRKYGRWPSSIEDLDEMGGTSEFYVDPWGTGIDLRESFLVSAGMDKTWDNDDDVWYDVELEQLGGHEPEIDLPDNHPLLWGNEQRLEEIIQQSTDNQADMQRMLEQRRRMIEGN